MIVKVFTLFTLFTLSEVEGSEVEGRKLEGFTLSEVEGLLCFIVRVKREQQALLLFERMRELKARIYFSPASPDRRILGKLSF